MAERDVYDPLSEVTRKERRLLLGMSTIGIAIVRTGLLPTKISALGIEFGAADQRSLLNILAVITAYFLVAFVVYAASDWVAWTEVFWERDATPRKGPRFHNRSFYWSSLLARSFFEFVLPIIVGIVAEWILLTAKI